MLHQDIIPLLTVPLFLHLHLQVIMLIQQALLAKLLVYLVHTKIRPLRLVVLIQMRDIILHLPVPLHRYLALMAHINPILIKNLVFFLPPVITYLTLHLLLNYLVIRGHISHFQDVQIVSMRALGTMLLQLLQLTNLLVK